MQTLKIFGVFGGGGGGFGGGFFTSVAFSLDLLAKVTPPRSQDQHPWSLTLHYIQQSP